MGFIRNGTCWVPITDRKVVDAIINPTDEQVRWWYLDEYTKIFPQFTEADEVSYYSHSERNAIVLYMEGERGVKLPPGSYKTTEFEYEPALIELPVYADEYIQLYNGHHNLVEDVRKFFANQGAYDQLGLAHRRGALLYGDPGNGKTRMAIEVANTVVSQGISTILHTSTAGINLFSIGQALDGMPCVLILEELTAQRDLPGLLSFLDGEESWTNVYVIATTNYPGELQANLVDRPGRFDLLVPFDNPDKAQRATYLSRFMDPSDSLLEKTEGLSIAYIKYVISEHLINGVPIESLLEDIARRKTLIKRHFSTDKDMGFF